MSTHACWRLWVGVRMGWMELTEASRSTDELLKKLNLGEPYVVDGVEIEAIHMNGKIVGYGVVISELSWGTEIEKGNVFPQDAIAKAEDVRPKVDEILGRVGIGGQVLILHHIDLGS